MTSVRSSDAKDWCTTGKCSATRFTVEGYIHGKNEPVSVEYVLECVEVLANEPSPHLTIVCVRVHANNDYSVILGADTVAFEPEKEGASKADAPAISAYSIVSERETRGQGR